LPPSWAAAPRPSREIRRNGALWRGTEWTYRPYVAQARADARRPRPKAGKISRCPQLRDYIQERLERRWSPEQIAHQLRRDFPHDREMRPNGHRAEHFHQALTVTISQLPPHLRRSLTWDQGNEMAGHELFSVAANMPVYFCNPGSPWQRGSNENMNGLLRQYFPKGTDLSRHTREHLDAVAAEINSRPRKTLDWETPAERLQNLMGPGIADSTRGLPRGSFAPGQAVRPTYYGGPSLG
jgi:IS30 family transposase